MPTQLGIYNEALGHAQSHDSVETLAEVSAAKGTLDRFWRTAVEASLEGSDWDFARRYLPLTGAISTPNPQNRWNFWFTQPADVLRPWSLRSARDEQSVQWMEGHKWERHTDAANGLVIATDIEEPILRYTSRTYITDLANWTATFGNAVAFRLAYMSVNQLAGARASVRAQLLQDWQVALESAHTARVGEPEQESWAPNLMARNRPLGTRSF